MTEEATRPAMPLIHGAVHDIRTSLCMEGISKDRANKEQHYKFRGVEDYLNVLSDLFVQHRVTPVPRVISYEWTNRQTSTGKPMNTTFVRMAFDLTHVDDGSVMTFEGVGEGGDMSDKASNKAQSAAFKYAMTLGFCIPTEGLDEGDATSPGQEQERPRDGGGDNKSRGRDDKSRADDERMIKWVEAVKKGLKENFTKPEHFDKLTEWRDNQRGKLDELKKANPSLYAEVEHAIGLAVARVDDVPF